MKQLQFPWGADNEEFSDFERILVDYNNSHPMGCDVVFMLMFYFYKGRLPTSREAFRKFNIDRPAYYYQLKKINSIDLERFTKTNKQEQSFFAALAKYNLEHRLKCDKVFLFQFYCQCDRLPTRKEAAELFKIPRRSYYYHLNNILSD